MKRIIISCLVVLALVETICYAVPKMIEKDCDFRSADVIEIQKDESDNTTVFITEDGNEWKVDYLADYDEVNPTDCYLTFDKMGTESIYDDSIVAVSLRH